MERYNEGQTTERTTSDPVDGWTAPGGETGLEEPMWQLGLGGEPESYPDRPDEPDCIYYLRTGFCGYGARCRFNHPRDRSAAVGAMRASGGDYPERVGHTICQYYMRTGMCKFGASCKYHHPRQGGGSATPMAFNIYGYPLRPGEKDCSYYVKTGECKFGVTCKYHHPQPTGMLQLPPPVPLAPPGHMVAPPGVGGAPPPNYPTMLNSSQQFGVVSGNWSVPRPTPTLPPGSYIPGTYGPVLLPLGMVTVPGWTPYPAHVNPITSPNAQLSPGASSLYGITQLSSSAPPYTGQGPGPGQYLATPGTTQKEISLPDRPGQPECQYYMKTGECKYGASCKYHHPPEWTGPKTNVNLSSIGLPLRPGAPVCSHYAQNGLCKFGHSCKFDHPVGSLSYSPSASSLADMPVAPYPVGSSFGTLAPSSSSSDLKPELISGTTRISSMNTSSGSVGSMFSNTGPGPSNTIGGGNISHGGEVQTSTE